MRYFIIIAFLFVSFNLLSQTNNDSLICLPKTQVIAAATKLRDCKVENMKYENLIHELKSFITDQDTVIYNYSEMLAKKDIEINVYREALGNYGIQDRKISWYKNPKTTFLIGILTGGSLVYIGTKIFTN